MQRAEVEGEEVEDDHRHDAEREDDGEQILISSREMMVSKF